MMGRLDQVPAEASSHLSATLQSLQGGSPGGRERAGQSPREEAPSKGEHRGASLSPSQRGDVGAQCSLLILPGAADGWLRPLHWVP